jgi:hypothetical protein
MDGESLAAYKEMQRVIKFVLDTRMHSLMLQPRHERTRYQIVIVIGQEILNQESLSMDY